MSGGSSGYIGGGGGGTPVQNCQIVERGPLNSPKQAVVSRLSVNDILTVEYRNQALVALDKQGKEAGSLVPRQLLELIECIEKGRKYVAVVLKVTGGLCEVEIRPHV